MATIALTSADRNTVNGAILLTWEALGNADVGGAHAVPFAADTTVQVIGTFGGATVKLQGSNNGADWFDLTKKGGTSAASVTAAGGFAVNEMPAFIRPSTSGGTGTDVDVIVCVHGIFGKVSY
jgi:hypothetical protein